MLTFVFWCRGRGNNERLGVEPRTAAALLLQFLCEDGFPPDFAGTSLWHTVTPVVTFRFSQY